MHSILKECSCALFQAFRDLFCKGGSENYAGTYLYNANVVSNSNATQNIETTYNEIQEF